MIIEQNLPPQLSQLLAAESKEFVVKSSRAYPRRSAIFFLAFGTLWLLITSVLIFGFFGPLIFEGKVNFIVNGEPTTASWDNLEPLLFPGILLSVFIIIGLAVFTGGLYCLFKKGGYFIGTANRLIEYSKGNIRSIDWEQFNGDITLNGDNQKGNITLVMRSGRMVSHEDSNDEYVPDTIYMAGISNAFEVERICRKRIKENDPTPVNR